MTDGITELPLRLSTPDDSDELARAEVYGLLAQLFYAPPDRGWYEQLRVAPTEAPAQGGFLEASWMELVAASRRKSVDEVAEEYDALFGGIGRPEVFLFGSHHIAGALNEKPLVALRDSLRALGIERAAGIDETEDHISCLCEVMRFLIAGDDVSVSNLTNQQRFFDEHLRGWSDAMLDQISTHPAGDFYRALAAFAKDFLAVESQGFDMLE